MDFFNFADIPSKQRQASVIRRRWLCQRCAGAERGNTIPGIGLKCKCGYYAHGYYELTIQDDVEVWRGCTYAPEDSEVYAGGI